MSFVSGDPGMLRRHEWRPDVPDHPAEEIKRLQRCINDLVSVLALPAVWRGGDRSQIVRTLLDALLGMLRLDFVYVRVNDPDHAEPIEMARVAQTATLPARQQAIGEALGHCLGPDPQQWAPLVGNPFGDGDISIVPLRLGLQGDIGVIVAGSRRADFPAQTEGLLLSVAANQAAIALQEARLLSEQKWVAAALEQRFAQRSRELAAANEELRKEIAERRRAEEALREAERNSRLIVDSVPGLVATLTPTGDVEIVNDKVIEYYGRTLEELKKWGTGETIHPEDLPRVTRTLTQAITSGEPYEIEERLRRFDGAYRWFQVRGLPLRDKNGRIVRWYVLLTDIDERKRGEEALQRNEAFLAEGQHLAQMGNFSWRVASGEIAWSEQLYRIFGLDPAMPVTLDLIGSRVHPEDMPMLEDMVSRARAGAGGFEYEHRLQMPDGSVKCVHMVAHATRDADGRLEYIGAAQDVTRRRLSEEALAKARSELAHVTRVTSLGVLTASIAHEVNQPLAAIITNGQSALRRLARADGDVDKVREIMTRMVADARRAAAIIDRIRTMATRRAPEQTPLSLDDVVADSMLFLRHELQARGVSVSLDLTPALPRVVGDRTQLQQVVVNLTINAVQAMAQSAGVRRNILVRTMLSAPETVCCTIEDSGPGIDPAHLPHLFDSFFTTKDAGMGMGLAISRSIVEAHAGHIRADNDSTLGGARFSFALPADEGSAGSPL